jgi:hypothetical protein
MIIKNQQQFQFNWRLIVKYLFFSVFFILFLLILFNFDYFKINFLKQKITFEPETNFFDQAINLNLTSPLKNAEIYYTVDGSDPDTNSLLFEDSISVSETTSFKFALFKNNQQVSSVQTHDVFINTEHQLALISLTTNPINLWDEEIGIYTEVNCTQKGREWERPATINFYEEDGSLGFSREVGIRIHGGGSRSLPQKSFRILIRNEDSDQTLKYPLFPDSSVQTFNSFVLRNAGGDWSYAYMRDALMHEIIEDSDLSVDLQDYRPVVLYLNGQYWGLYNIRERHDEYYFANKYGADVGRVNIYNVPHDVGVNRGKIELDEGKDKGGVDLYNKLFEDTKRCPGCASLDYLKQYIDLVNYRDYLISQFHFGNYDWPYGNSKAWRYETNAFEPNAPEGLDGRFRWLVFDLDVGFGAGVNDEEKMKKSAEGDSYGRLIDDRFPFRNLFYDHTFANEFINKYADMLNTIFKYENVEAKIDELAAVIESEIPRQIEKWHKKDNWKGIVSDEEFIEEVKVLSSVEDWRRQIDLLKVRAKWRPVYMKENTVNFFKLSGISQIQLSANDPAWGSIKINSIVIEDDQMPWTGEYFKDVRISIEAIPKRGRRFVSWKGYINSKSSKIDLLIDSDINLEAVFE